MTADSFAARAACAGGSPAARSRPSRFPTPNPYRDAATAAILAEAECWRWDRLEMLAGIEAGDDDPALPAGVAFCDLRIGQAAAELARRQRLARRPDAPRWPDRWPDLKAEAADLKRSVSVAEFAGRYLGADLRPQGRRMVGRCPLPDHDDGSPSFVVYPDAGGWYCFGCHRGGDVFTLAMIAHGTERFGDAVAILREWAGGRTVLP